MKQTAFSFFERFFFLWMLRQAETNFVISVTKGWQAGKTILKNFLPQLRISL